MRAAAESFLIELRGCKLTANRFLKFSAHFNPGSMLGTGCMYARVETRGRTSRRAAATRREEVWDDTPPRSDDNTNLIYNNNFIK
ncbi:unnamed protein product [Parnassius mnemosyne]|uniref:Uncharacterized protein n=1 Tax=Parnassius mnemosyne TaxID=213953 RepID=A0AAV1LJM1_9NEOP